MELLLQILGVVFLVLLLVIVVGIVYVRRKMAKFGADMMDSLFEMGGTLPPIALHLSPAEAPEWSNPDSVASAESALLKIGFRKAGNYVITNLPNTFAAGFADPVRGYYAAVTEHPAALMVDLVMESSDGKVITVTDGALADVRDTEEAKVVSMPGESVEALYTAFQQLRPVDLRPTSLENFSSYFEDVYRRSMERKYLSGDLDLSVLGDLTHLPFCGLDEETYKFLVSKNLISDTHLVEILRKQLQESVSYSWYEENEPNLVFIIDGMSASDIIDQLDLVLEDEPRDLRKLLEAIEGSEGKRGRELFWEAVEESGFSDLFERHSTPTEPKPHDVILFKAT